jgi:hypothetical protein
MCWELSFGTIQELRAAGADLKPGLTRDIEGLHGTLLYSSRGEKLGGIGQDLIQRGVAFIAEIEEYFTRGCSDCLAGVQF